MRTWLTILLIVIGSLLSYVEADADASTVITTVSAVYWHKTPSGVPYCNIALRNGRTLNGVEAGLCNAKPRGSTITLVYADVKVESQSCDWRGRCKATTKTVYNLVSWY